MFIIIIIGYYNDGNTEDYLVPLIWQ